LGERTNVNSFVKLSTICLAGLISLSNIVAFDAFGKDVAPAGTGSASDLITKDTLGPSLTPGGPRETMGNLILGCAAGTADKLTCNLSILTVINYCVNHMTDSNAKQNSQICLDKDIMDSAFNYALDNLETPNHDISHKYATIVANRINEDVAGIG
jgi:hypothetical protein